MFFCHQEAEEPFGQPSGPTKVWSLKKLKPRGWKKWGNSYWVDPICHICLPFCIGNLNWNSNKWIVWHNLYFYTYLLSWSNLTSIFWKNGLKPPASMRLFYLFPLNFEICLVGSRVGLLFEEKQSCWGTFLGFSAWMCANMTLGSQSFKFMDDDGIRFFAQNGWMMVHLLKFAHAREHFEMTMSW